MPENNQPKDAFATLKLPHDGGTIPFPDLEAVEKWLKSEQDAWEQVLGSGGFRTWNTAAEGGNRRFQRTLQDLRQHRKKKPANDDLSAQVQRILDGFQKDQCPPIASSTDLGKRILKLAERDVDTAGAALAFLQGGRLPAGQDIPPTALRGAFAGLKFTDDFLPGHEPLREARQLKDQLGALVDEVKAEADEHSRWQQKFRKHAEAQLQKDRDHHKLELEKRLKDAEQRIEEHERTLNEKVRLSKPREYWKGRAAREGRSARKWGGGFLGVTGGAILVAVLLFDWFRTVLLAMQGAEYAAVGLVGGVAAIVGYLLRQVARITVSHFHLQTDAEERVAIIDTYLSMLEDKQLQADKDRHLVLQQIFRRSHTGLVREDGDHGVGVNLTTTPSHPR